MSNWLRNTIANLPREVFQPAARKTRRRSDAPTQHPTRTCRAILARLRDLGVDLPGPDSRYRVVNLRTGHWQRSAGAWSWSLDDADPPGEEARMTMQIGGYFPASECARPGAALSQGVTGYSLDPPGATSQPGMEARDSGPE